jgi:hypothetical protein
MDIGGGYVMDDYRMEKPVGQLPVSTNPMQSQA